MVVLVILHIIISLVQSVMYLLRCKFRRVAKLKSTEVLFVSVCVCVFTSAASDWICDAGCLVDADFHSDDYVTDGVGTECVWERADAEQRLFLRWQLRQWLAAAVVGSDRRWHWGSGKQRSAFTRAQEQPAHGGHDGRGDQAKRSSTPTQQASGCSLSPASSGHHQPATSCTCHPQHS